MLKIIISNFVNHIIRRKVLYDVQCETSSFLSNDSSILNIGKSQDCFSTGDIEREKHVFFYIYITDGKIARKKKRLPIMDT